MLFTGSTCDYHFFLKKLVLMELPCTNIHSIAVVGGWSLVAVYTYSCTGTCVCTAVLLVCILSGYSSTKFRCMWSNTGTGRDTHSHVNVHVHAHKARAGTRTHNTHPIFDVCVNVHVHAHLCDFCTLLIVVPVPGTSTTIRKLYCS